MRLLAIFALLLTACGGTLTMGPLDPIYELPTMSLEEKEKKLWQADVDATHLNEFGTLLYTVRLPIDEPGNYERSHDIADMPSWHGWHLGALALRMSVEGDPDMELHTLLHKGLQSVNSMFTAVGKVGLLPRSYVKHCGERLWWMETKEQKPTKYWRKSTVWPACFWVRTGSAKGHYMSLMMGLATVQHLHEEAAIFLEPDTAALLNMLITDIGHFFIENEWKVVDFDGVPTEFGNLSDYNINGQSGMAVLAILKSCAVAGSARCEAEYERLGNNINTMPIYAALLAAAATDPLIYKEFYKNNDTMHFAEMALVFALLHDPHRPLDRTVLRLTQVSMSQLRDIFKVERNPFLNYVDMTVQGETNRGAIEDSLWTLRLFPDDKRQIQPLEDDDQLQVQPLANLRINSHYWKTKLMRKKALTSESERTMISHSSQDFRFVYWLGRHMGYISEEEAQKEVAW